MDLERLKPDNGRANQNVRIPFRLILPIYLDSSTEGAYPACADFYSDCSLQKVLRFPILNHEFEITLRFT